MSLDFAALDTLAGYDGEDDSGQKEGQPDSGVEHEMDEQSGVDQVAPVLPRTRTASPANSSTSVGRTQAAS